MFMIMLILNDSDQCQSILDAWDEAGAPGVTVLRSTGLGHIRSKMGLHDDVPLMPSLEDFFQQDENLHRTLIAIVRGRPVVDAIIQATQSMLGDLNQPHTGILVVLPVLEAYGLDRFSE
jgi:nitrogen regulatory protein PII